MKAKTHQFKDGSSLEILENGTYILRETKTAMPVSLAQESKPVNYNDPPPPLPAGAPEPELAEPK